VEGRGPRPHVQDQGPIRFGRRSMRARIFLLVMICAVPAVIGSLVGQAALTSVHDSVVQMDERSVRPLSALGDLRDMEGDTRDEVWEYVANPASHAEMREQILATDKQADSDITAYFAAHGSQTDRIGMLMKEFETRLGAWRAVRDQQVFTAADAGNLPKAYIALHGPLAAADDSMSEPIDQLYTEELKAAGTRRHQADVAFTQARLLVAGIIGAGLIIALLAAWWLTRGMLRVIGAIRTALAASDQSLRVRDDDGSELGALAKALDTMLDEAAEREAALKRAQQGREDQLKDASVRQRQAEQEVRHRAQTVVDDTGQAVAVELERVAAQAEAVRTSAATIQSRVGAANQVTRSVVEQSLATDGVVNAVNDSLRKVGGIAKLIAGVAEQTNLLALNATIEAARAGEAGRGFSVVAHEVKELAATTARSTTEISRTLATLESDAAAMAATIRTMSDGIGGLDEATGQLSTVATEQQETVEELDRCVADAIARIQAMSQFTERLDRRVGTRVPTGPVRITVIDNGSTFEVSMLDLSAGGMRCVIDPRVTLTVGTIVLVDLSAVDVAENINARIARRGPSADGDDLGMEFLQLSDAGRDQINRYLQRIKTTEGAAAS
jgi:methyl-accepting chemotaxis protein